MKQLYALTISEEAEKNLAVFQANHKAGGRQMNQPTAINYILEALEPATPIIDKWHKLKAKLSKARATEPVIETETSTEAPAPDNQIIGA